MNKDVYDIGTMLYHPYRKMVGWIINVTTIRIDEQDRTTYTIEWADGEHNGEHNGSFYLADWHKAYNNLANE